MSKRNLTNLLKVIAFVGAVVFAVVFWRGGAAADRPIGMQEFFSDDDGATWFADDGTKIAPFNHNGKEAVLAHVYQTMDGKKFVGYLEKYSSETRSRLQHKARSAGMSAATTRSSDLVLVKKPKTGDWVEEDSASADAVRQISCPDGGKNYTVVLPGGE